MNKIFLIFLFFGCIHFINAQSLDGKCEKYISSDFTIFEKDYKLEINSTEEATLHVTCYEDFIYRFVTCSNHSNEKLIFSIYDSEDNLLYTNENYSLTPYWDFKFNSTLECVVKIKKSSKIDTKSTISLIIGYKGVE